MPTRGRGSKNPDNFTDILHGSPPILDKPSGPLTDYELRDRARSRVPVRLLVPYFWAIEQRFLIGTCSPIMNDNCIYMLGRQGGWTCQIIINRLIIMMLSCLTDKCKTMVHEHDEAKTS